MMSIDELKALIGERRTVRVWHNHLPADAPPTAEGELIGLCDHPSIIVQGPDGQKHFSAQLRIEVLPLPLPPEPPVGSVVLDRDGDAWQHTGKDDLPWRGAHVGECSWKSLNLSHGPLCRLVPDPADDAPELPWGCDDAEDDGDRLSIEPARRTDLAAFVKTSQDGVRLTAADARQAAAALLRAAREVERP